MFVHTQVSEISKMGNLGEKQKHLLVEKLKRIEKNHHILTEKQLYLVPKKSSL